MTNLTNTAALVDAFAGLTHEKKSIEARLETLKAEIYQAAGDDKELVGDTCLLAIVDKKGPTSLDKDLALALLRQLGATEEQVASLFKTGKASKSLMLKPKLALAI